MILNYILHLKYEILIQAEYKTATGSDWQPAGGAPAKKEKKPAKDVAKPKEKVEI